MTDNIFVVKCWELIVHDVYTVQIRGSREGLGYLISIIFMMMQSCRSKLIQSEI